MKKIYKIIALLALMNTFAITSCQSSSKDSDFDGLTDNIDPDPNNNQYQISLLKQEEEEEETNTLTMAMDYRDFLRPDYQYNLGLLSSLLVNAVNTSYQPKVHNNVYPKAMDKEAEVCPLLAQIGAKNIQKITVSSTRFETDPYDVANMIMGHHTFTNDNLKYQVYFVIVDPYISSTGWISNFDIGALNEDGSFPKEYTDLEGNNHPDWTNHIEHKGFMVSAVRLLKAIDEYQKAHKVNDAKTITFVTGHSRGGAIANLIGKTFVDNKQEVRAYCFNPANSTLTNEETAKNEKYQASIFNIINNGDLVSRIPAFNFRLYGKDIKQDINTVTYQQFLKKEYEGNSSTAVDAIEALLNKVVTKDGKISRNNFYKFRDKDDYYPERWEGDSTQMNALLEDLNNGVFMPKDTYAYKCFTYDSEVQYDSDEDTYYIGYQTRPAIIKALLVDILDKQNFDYILSYIKLLDRLITETLETSIGNDFSIAGVRSAHEQLIACVMAMQLDK